MRLAGYVRESADAETGRSAFGQHERIRRYAEDHGHLLVAVCQDLRRAGEPTGRDGFVGLLGVVESGAADAIVVEDIATFSADAIVQEIVLWDLRRRGVRILSTDDGDADLLDPVPPSGPRMLIRDVLERVEQHAAPPGPSDDPTEGDPTQPTIGLQPDGDVMVRLVEADVAEAQS